LRTNLEGSDPAQLWSQYIQLTEVEAVFRALKSDLAIRPIWHFTPKRVEAHIMVAFLEYCLWVCLKHKLKASAPSLTPWQLLDQFARIQMVEVWFKLRAGGCICLERITQPEAAQAAHKLEDVFSQVEMYMTEHKVQDAAGFAKDASALSAQLSKSGLFKDVSLRSAIKAPGAEGERFDIAIRVRSPARS